jgi:hypothetical protein
MFSNVPQNDEHFKRNVYWSRAKYSIKVAYTKLILILNQSVVCSTRQYFNSTAHTTYKIMYRMKTIFFGNLNYNLQAYLWNIYEDAVLRMVLTMLNFEKKIHFARIKLLKDKTTCV